MSANEGYVYILKYDDFYKIGRTKNPEQRFASYVGLKTGKRGSIICCVACNDYIEKERSLRLIFRANVKKGREWLNLCKRELEFAIQLLIPKRKVKPVQSLTIRNPETLFAIDKISKLEERKPHDTAERLFRKSAIAKLARMKKK